MLFYFINTFQGLMQEYYPCSHLNNEDISLFPLETLKIILFRFTVITLRYILYGFRCNMYAFSAYKFCMCNNLIFIYYY